VNLALPPPRRENLVSGVVRVPAGYTVVLGGVVSTRDDESTSSVPLLGDIPLLGELFKDRLRSSSNDTLFVFIRPVILRDPAFRDLMFLSQADIRQARIAQQDYPSNPLKTFDGEMETDVPEGGSGTSGPAADDGGKIPTDCEADGRQAEEGAN